MYNADNQPRVGDMVQVTIMLRDHVHRTANNTAGQIGMITAVFDAYVRLDIEKNHNGGLWFDEISPAVEFEYEYI